MIKNCFFYYMVILSFTSVVGYSHAGHDHTPGAIAAPHGGVVQGTDNLYWELITDSTGVSLYPLTHELASIPLKDVSLTGTTQLPKKSKKEPVTFSAADDHYTAKIDAKGSYRYTLELLSNYKGKKEKLKFQIEPQH